MRNPDDVARAKGILARQLARKDIGKTHQRALLHGMLSALEWSEGVSSGNARALQRLFDGEEIAASEEAQIGGGPLSKVVGRAKRGDLIRKYQQQTGDVNLSGYVTWLESQITGVGLIVA